MKRMPTFRIGVVKEFTNGQDVVFRRYYSKFETWTLAEPEKGPVA